MTLRSWLLLIALLGAAPVSAAAQAVAPSDASGGVTIGMWAGVAEHSREILFGHARGTDVAVAALRLAHTFSRSDRLAFDYVADIVPAAWVSMPPRVAPAAQKPCPPQEYCAHRNAGALDTFSVRRAVFGFGGAPFGLQMRLRPTARVQPFVAGTAGALWFREPVPSPRAGRFNFTAELGGGVLLLPSPGFGVLLGYKLHHISNGGTQRANPGIDSNMFYVGVQRMSLH